MSQIEKRGVLRARVRALHQRAGWLANEFTTPATREQVVSIIERLEEELERLQAHTEPQALPRLQQFLPQTTAALERLMDLYRTAGRHARPFTAWPRRLDERLPHMVPARRRRRPARSPGETP